MIAAPRTAEPSTAALTNGKPCSATAASESSGRYCAVTVASATQKTNVRKARTHATRARTSATARRKQGHDPSAATRDRGAVDGAADRFDPVAHARQAGTRRRGPYVVARAVVLDDAFQRTGLVPELDADHRRAGVLDGVLNGLQAAEVGGCLHARRATPDVLSADVHGDRTREDRLANRRADPVVREQPGVDTTGQQPEGVDGVESGLLLASQDVVRAHRRLRGQSLGEAE